MSVPEISKSKKDFVDVNKALIGKNSNNYIYESYSGVDIVAEILLPNESGPLALGELQTISYSIHRESKPIRILGHTNISGTVKGPRTIAGSMIFTVFNTYAFYRLQQYRDIVYGQNGKAELYPLADMLPPFDLVLTFSNESGRSSKMVILGMTIVDEGGTMSIDDMISEQTFTWMARGIQPLVRYMSNSAPSYLKDSLAVAPAILSGPNNRIF